MEQFGITKTCLTCKLWVKSTITPTLNTCVANSHIELTGPTFFCANWEPVKKANKAHKHKKAS